MSVPIPKTTVMKSTPEQPFDRYAKSYSDLLDDSIKITGYEGDHFLRCKLKKLQALFGKRLNRPFNFLDFGCGAGRTSEQISKYFPTAHYVGVDASPKMIHQAKKNSACDFFHLEETDWKQKSYQLILAANVFHHIPPAQHSSQLQDLKSVLAPGGSLVVWEHNPLNPVTRKIVRDCEFDRDAILIPARKMKAQLRKSSSQPVKILYTTFFPKSLSWFAPLESRMEWLPLGAQYLAIIQAPNS